MNILEILAIGIIIIGTPLIIISTIQAIKNFWESGSV